VLVSVENKKLAVCIGGPTGVGKTKLSVFLAQKYNIPILSADSRQIYKELNIGSGKPSISEMQGVPHYFISSSSVYKPISTGKFETQAIAWLDSYFKDNQLIIICGGTGLYHRAICRGLDKFPKVIPGVREQLQKELEKKGLQFLLAELQEQDPEYYAEVDRQNPRRITRALEVIRSSHQKFSAFRKQKPKKRSFECLQIFLSDERKALYDRINSRVDQMLEDGLEEEARVLSAYRDLPSLRTVGYQEFFDYFDGTIDYEEAVRLIKRNSRRYAKRQLTWYRNQGWLEFDFNDWKFIEEWMEDQLKKRGMNIKSGQNG